MTAPWYIEPLRARPPKPLARHRMIELRMITYEVEGQTIGFNPFSRLLPRKQIINNTLVVPFKKWHLNLENMKWQEAQANE